MYRWSKNKQRFYEAYRMMNRAYKTYYEVKYPYHVEYDEHGWIVSKVVGTGEQVFKVRVTKFEEMAREVDMKVCKTLRVELIEKQIKNIIGEKAFNALKEGKALFHIWRRTTPHNQWVEDADGNMLWHSSEGNSISLTHFEKIDDIGDVIKISLNPHEIGTPDHTIYKMEYDLNRY